MIRIPAVIVLVAASFVGAFAADWPAQPVRRPLVLGHYMPWYVAKPAAPYWGWHS